MEADIKKTRLFHYLKSGNHTSNQVSSIWFGDNEKYHDNLRYKYDDKGNILEVKENGVVIARYQYDGLSRLVREDNKPMSKTTTYEYDAGGNISCKTEYAFTLSSSLDEKTPFAVIPYTYASSGNRDRLMSYDGENFTYDLIGNPTKYRDVILTWEKGRQLRKYANIEYSYNAQGIRTKKVNGNAITEYYLDGSRILAQKDIVIAGDNTQVETTMHFIYGLDGISGFTINNQNYYYKKNLQGDIIGIYDNNLNLIVKYDYDAWGEHKIYYLDNGNFVDLDTQNPYTNISNTNLYIALKNPFRYRGYYYDSETGLYYLNSRYYDPEICRFINADDISVLSEGKEFINGLNLFSYCNNNPIMNIDDSGYAWWDWIVNGLQIVAGAILVATGVGAGFGATLIVGGTIGLASNALGSTIGGGIGSMANGWGAISTGVSLFSYGPFGIIAGIALITVGGATIAFGANEVAYGITGHNYIQEWTGMSDSTYAGLYSGLNIVSSIGTIAGRLGMRSASTNTLGRYDSLKASGQKPYAKIIRGKNIYYFDGMGNAYWSIHNVGLINQHWHTSLGRDNSHIYSYIKFLIKFIFKKW